MPQLIKNRAVIEDTWQLLEKDSTFEQVPAEGAVIVPLALWLANKDALQTRTELGVWLDSDEEVESIADDLSHFAVVALNFPAFTDGRSFSSARLLRERYGYTGEVRAIGDVGRDLLFMMQRCGFDAFVMCPGKDPHAALNSLSDFSVSYQGATDQPLPLFRRR